MKRIAVVMVGISLVAVLFLGSAVAETITVDGSGGPQAMLRDMAAAFTKANPGVKVEVPDSIGSGGGAKAAGEGKVELGRLARGLTEKEQVYGLSSIVFAKSPVVFITHPSIKIKGITSAQSRGIFAGAITNWNELGGPDKKIRVIIRHKGEANLRVIEESVSGWTDLEFTSKSKTPKTDQEMSEMISSIDGAIGFGPLNEAIINGQNALALDGKGPMDDGYPANAEYFFVYKPERLKGAVKDFVDFVFSPEGAKIIAASNGVPVQR